MEHIKLFKCLYYVPNNHIISELRCHGNLLTSPKTAPLCLRQVLVVRIIFFIICHDLALPCGIHSEWRISLRFFAGDLSLPCGIALIRSFYASNTRARYIVLSRLGLVINFIQWIPLRSHNDNLLQSHCLS